MPKAGDIYWLPEGAHERIVAAAKEPHTLEDLQRQWLIECPQIADAVLEGWSFHWEFERTAVRLIEISNSGWNGEFQKLILKLRAEAKAPAVILRQIRANAERAWALAGGHDD